MPIFFNKNFEMMPVSLLLHVDIAHESLNKLRLFLHDQLSLPISLLGSHHSELKD